MAANDVLQLAVLMAVFAAGLQYMRSTPGGEDILQVCRRAILGLLIRAPADLPQDYVVLPKSDGVGNVAPYSYSGCIAHDPPTLVVSCCRRPDGRSILCPAGSRAIGLPLRNGFRFSR